MSIAISDFVWFKLGRVVFFIGDLDFDAREDLEGGRVGMDEGAPGADSPAILPVPSMLGGSFVLGRPRARFEVTSGGF